MTDLASSLTASVGTGNDWQVLYLHRNGSPIGRIARIDRRWHVVFNNSETYVSTMTQATRWINRRA